MNRPSIPIAIERDVKIESGHRCAIPTCKLFPIQLAHIEPYSKCQVPIPLNIPTNSGAKSPGVPLKVPGLKRTDNLS
jgi:hypothetical protein